MAKRTKKKTTSRKRRKRTYDYMNLRTGGFLNKELKYYDLQMPLTASPVLISGSVHDPVAQSCIFAPTQGSGQSNRDGNLCSIYSVYIEGKVLFAGTVNSGVPPLNQMQVVYLVLDTQTNGAQAPGSDVFESPGGTGLELNAFKRIENSSRFKILKKIRLDNQLISMTENANDLFSCMVSQKTFKIYHRFSGPVITRFLTNGGTVADIRDHSLHVYTVGTSSATQVGYNSRIRFSG